MHMKKTSGKGRLRFMRGMYHFICFVLWAGFAVVPMLFLYSLVAFWWVPVGGAGLLGGIFFLRQRYFARVTFSDSSQIVISLGLVGMALLANGLGYYALARLFPLLVVFYVAFSKMHIRMSAVDTSLENITRTSKQPVGLIIGRDYRFAGVLGVLVLVLAVVIYFGVVGPLFSAVGQMRPNWQIEPSPPERDSFFGDGMFGEGMFAPGDIREPSPLITQLLNMLFWLIGGSVAFFAGVYILRLIIRGIITFFMEKMKRKKFTAVEGLEYEEEKEFILPITKRRWREAHRHGENEVRKQFRLIVNKHIKKGIPIKKTDTPAQMEQKITTENLNELTDAYRQARYG